MIQTPVRPRTFDRSGFYFIGLLVIGFLGFWRSYFSKFFYGTLDYSFYFHFHAVMMVLWTLMLIAQPILIRKKKLAIHKLIGKASYIVMPLLLISVLMVLHAGLNAVPIGKITFMAILFPFRDFWFLIVFYSVAVIYKSNIHIHARAMVATGIVFIEPSLARFIGGPPTWILILILLITLFILDRNQKSGRWIFPGMLIVFIISYTFAITHTQVPLLDSFVRWFTALPLT
jgi:hypothetical protein